MQNVPRVADAVLDWAFARDPEMGVTTWGPSPVVFEYTDMDVTIEPAGGSLQPTGVTVLRGRLFTP